MTPNTENLERTLRDRYCYIPVESKLREIQSVAERYLRSTKEKLEDEFKTETEFYLAGSVAERFSVPISSHWIKTEGLTEDCHALLSDFDFMVSPISEKVSFDEQSERYHACQTTYTHLLPVDDEDHEHLQKDNRPSYPTKFPYYNIIDIEGYALHAGLEKENLEQIARSIEIDSFPEHIEENYFRLCLTFCCHRHINFAKVNVEGPSIKYQIGSSAKKIDRFYGDLTYSLKCSEWPATSDWGQRQNAKWPTQKEIQQIKSYGCHFVPQSQKQSASDSRWITIDDDNVGETWRISFSRAEVELSKLVPVLLLRKRFAKSRS